MRLFDVLTDEEIQMCKKMVSVLTKSKDFPMIREYAIQRFVSGPSETDGFKGTIRQNAHRDQLAESWVYAVLMALVSKGIVTEESLKNEKKNN